MFVGSDPGHRPRHGSSCMLWWRPTYKEEEEWHRYKLNNNLPQAKRGKLAADVSLGPIFLTKKINKYQDSSWQPYFIDLDKSLSL